MKKKFYIPTFIWLICSFLPLNKLLGTDTLRITNVNFLELNDGLQNRIIRQLEVDHQQYVWLRLDSGIHIFDGEDFIDYKKEDFSVGYSHVYSDSTGVYCSLDNFNVQYYSTYTAQPKIYKPQKKIKGKINSFSQNEKSFDYIFSTANDSFYFYKDYHNPILIGAIQWSKKIDAWIHFNDCIYFLSSDILYKIDDGKVEYVFGKGIANEALHFNDYLYTTGNLLVFSFRNKKGVYRLSPDGEVVPILSNKNLVFVSKDQSNQLALGTTSIYLQTLDQLSVFNLDSYLLLDASSVLQQNSYLTDVTGIDFKRKMLVSSFNGLYHFTYFSKGISSILKDPNISNSNFGPVIHDFAAFDNSLYFIREAEGLWKHSSEQISLLILSDPPLDYGLRQLEYDPKKDEFWILTYNPNRTYNLVNSTDREIKKVITYDLELQNVMWLNNNNEIGLIGHDENKNTYLKYLIDSDTTILVKDLGQLNVNYILDKTNKLWIATESGLTIENLDSGKQFQYPECKAASYIQELDDLIFVHSRGNGTFVFKNDSIIHRLNTKTVLNNDFTTGLLRDSQGNYWIGTFNGINILNSEFEAIYIIHAGDGLSANEMNTGAVYEDGTHFYFGTLNGITKIDPIMFLDNVKENNQFRTKVSYWINDVERKAEIENGIYLIDGKPSKIEITVETDNKIQQSNLSKLFDVNCDEVNCSIQFENNKIILTKPNSGIFSVELVSRLTKDKVNIGLIEVRRKISSVLFVILISLGVIFLSYLISSRLIRQNKAAADEKTELVRRVSEVELEALRSQMNPHFIFNSLNAIQYYILKNEKHLAGKYLSKFAKLIRMFLETSKSKHLTLEKEIEQLNLYLDLEKLRFEDKFTYDIEVDVAVNPQDEVIPSMLLQPFVENAILHGLNHRQGEDGYVKIAFSKKANNLICSIDDNGIGRKAAMEIKKSKKVGHQSRATQMIDERLELLKNLGDEKIDISYIDKYDKTNHSLGTKVIIRFYEKG